ncbi:ABC transporter permease [Pelagibaculum spongiae]|uniref:Peptide ABC transporter permease n=1 Tax=Pelagibaculum spongiae TaxID=2080658 RepID=A0A2V1H7M7_9GAMM|nr:ABC transporter permease [Pelagibaculum spongiae]PVZ72492.1 peptide ABC transporter permease [Pelagibaculum spongiae]
MFKLALQSLWNRRLTAALTIFSITISVVLLLGVERMRYEARDNFTRTIAGTDLLVGARSGGIQLLLYSVFHIGDATNNMRWSSIEAIRKQKKVDWVVPLSLGDSHQGFRVVGTEKNIFKRYKFGNKQSLTFAQGQTFDGVFQAVLGADVASQLNYQIDQKIVLSHGVEKNSLQQHQDKPFSVSGILQRTGTPLDRAILVSLQGIEALHIDWLDGAPAIPGFSISADRVKQMDLQPKAVTAAFVGLKSRIAAFSVQRWINEYSGEPLMAVLPGVTLQQLWQLISVVEKILLAISLLVVVAGLSGMLTAILTSLNERRREMAILRAVGARPLHIFILLELEALFYGLIGCLAGLASLYLLLGLLGPLLQSQYGITVGFDWPRQSEWLMLSGVLAGAALVGFIPAWRAYRNALSDGLSLHY